MSGEPRSILVRSPNWIGDQVLAYPFFHFLRRAFPRARIAAACAPWVEAIQFRNLVDEVFALPRPLRPGFRERVSVLERAAALLRDRGPWDLGIALPTSFSSAWLLYRAGASRRLGYGGDGRGWLLTDKARPEAGAHRAEAYARLLPAEAPPASPATAFWGEAPEDELDDGAPGVLSRFDAEAAWPLGPGERSVIPPASPYWVLAPGAAAESRRWPEERFAALARAVAERTGWTGVVVGGVAEAPLAARLCADRSLRLLDRTARGSVRVLSRLFSAARLTVACDSGLAHVACLFGSTVCVAWGAGNPARTRPLGPGRVRLVFNPVDCWPCERNECPREPGRGLECLAGIRPEALWAEVEKEIGPEIGKGAGRAR